MGRVAVFVGNKTSLNSTIVKECEEVAEAGVVIVVCLFGLLVDRIFVVVLPVCLFFIVYLILCSLNCGL